MLQSPQTHTILGTSSLARLSSEGFVFVFFSNLV